uniref:Large ribosomal subunit protein uL13c n=1 Tax=Polysiphonia infestans TaxID=2006978 RepID=A0A1Z1MF80_9FLOR|nr:ribosomal protein L13 [Polysiphonia infestans]ARW64421.1 ribosomal protein L13 [Polysiphonia infestans]
MSMNKNKTIIKESEKTAKWYIIDAQKYKLGRLASKATYLLTNKNEANYLPYQEGRSNIIIINSQNVRTTGRKSQQKTYKKHSGRPGSLKTEIFEKLQERIPNRIIEHAIKGMLPKNSLGRRLFKKVKIYPNSQHPHQSQNPITINID